jgi:hypothetical protein
MKKAIPLILLWLVGLVSATYVQVDAGVLFQPDGSTGNLTVANISIYPTNITVTATQVVLSGLGTNDTMLLTNGTSIIDNATVTLTQQAGNVLFRIDEIFTVSNNVTLFNATYIAGTIQDLTLWLGTTDWGNITLKLDAFTTNCNYRAQNTTGSIYFSLETPFNITQNYTYCYPILLRLSNQTVASAAIKIDQYAGAAQSNLPAAIATASVVGLIVYSVWSGTRKTRPS